jgi:probable phosphoglycerate mutase
MHKIYLARHAARQDKADKDEAGTWRAIAKPGVDTPISQRGIKQAILLGEYLKDKGIKRIISSPFLRAVQTAVIVGSQIDVRVQLNWAICEYLRSKWFRVPPELDAMALFRTLPGIVAPEIIGSIPKWPEGADDVIHRVRPLCDEVKAGGENALLVGHGASIRRAIQVLIRFKKPPLEEKVGRPHCAGLAEVEVDGESEKMNYQNKGWGI